MNGNDTQTHWFACKCFYRQKPMKRIIFFSVPAYGHLTAVRPVISKLVAEGNEVIWYCSAKYKDFVEDSGAMYKEYTLDFDSNCNLHDATDNIMNLLEYLLRFNREFFIAYNDIIESFNSDLILYDSMCSFAKNLAEKHGIPHVCFCTTLAYNFFTFVNSNLFFSSIKLIVRNFRTYIKLINDENRFRKRQGIRKLDMIDLFVNKGDITLVFSPKEFQPLAWTFSDNVKFVGTTIKDRVDPDNIDYDDYDAYISFGTIMTEQETLINEIKNSDFVKSRKVIINVGGLPKDSDYDNVNLVSRTNQISLLDHCRLFINHGGLNSVYESIYHGVVQVCIPQQEEQRMNAIIVQKKGLGFYMSFFDEMRLVNLEHEIPKCEKQISDFAKIIRKYDGTENAVKIINNMLDL